MKKVTHKPMSSDTQDHMTEINIYIYNNVNKRELTINYICLVNFYTSTVSCHFIHTYLAPCVRLRKPFMFSIPPRSPDLNPIENLFHLIQEKLENGALN